jgi:hypothetical protein
MRLTGGDKEDGELLEKGRVLQGTNERLAMGCMAVLFPYTPVQRELGSCQLGLKDIPSACWTPKQVATLSQVWSLDSAVYLGGARASRFHLWLQ